MKDVSKTIYPQQSLQLDCCGFMYQPRNTIKTTLQNEKYRFEDEEHELENSYNRIHNIFSYVMPNNGTFQSRQGHSYLERQSYEIFMRKTNK